MEFLVERAINDEATEWKEVGTVAMQGPDPDRRAVEALADEHQPEARYRARAVGFERGVGLFYVTYGKAHRREVF
jgi:hypothetical protein